MLSIKTSIILATPLFSVALRPLLIAPSLFSNVYFRELYWNKGSLQQNKISSTPKTRCVCVCVYLARRNKVRLAFYPTFMIRNGCVNSRELRQKQISYIFTIPLNFAESTSDRPHLWNSSISIANYTQCAFSIKNMYSHITNVKEYYLFPNV